MKKPDSLPTILVINAGSSSIRFAQYQWSEPLKRILHGKIDRIGMNDTKLISINSAQNHQETYTLTPSEQISPSQFLVDWLEKQNESDSIAALGHRIVQGMQHTAPALVTQDLLNQLNSTSAYDPEHMPREIELIEIFRRRHPKRPQLACFDTVFHRDMPRVAKLLAIPRRFQAKGIQRYGFHGLSFSYLMDELLRLGDPAASRGRVILAHLGSGASLAAVRDGQSIDTSMGFTPTAGLPMSTRSGDLDPGLFFFLAQTEKITAGQFGHMVNHESGLLGVSEISSDMRDLLVHETEDIRAAEAVALFCYQTKKWIGSFSAALGGLDTLVFSGGIGENAPIVRQRICQGLEFLGIKLQESLNDENASIISSEDSRVKVRMIGTDEELMLARSVQHSKLLDNSIQKENL